MNFILIVISPFLGIGFSPQPFGTFDACETAKVAIEQYLGTGNGFAECFPKTTPPIRP